MIAKLMQIDEFEKVRKQTSENQSAIKKQQHLKSIKENEDINNIDFTSYLDTVEKKTLEK